MTWRRSLFPATAAAEQHHQHTTRILVSGVLGKQKVTRKKFIHPSAPPSRRTYFTKTSVTTGTRQLLTESSIRDLTRFCVFFYFFAYFPNTFHLLPCCLAHPHLLERTFTDLEEYSSSTEYSGRKSLVSTTPIAHSPSFFFAITSYSLSRNARLRTTAQSGS